MPLPVLKIETAIESALEKSGALQNQSTAVEALTESGADVHRLATELANLVFTAKASVKLQAIRDAFKLHGIDISTAQSGGSSAPVINIQVVSDKTNLNNVFAPERNI